MCIIVALNPNKTVSEETLKTCWDANDDGAGFMFAKDNTLNLKKGFMNWESFKAAWKDVLYRAKLNQHHTISREQLSVRDFMTRILRRLQGERFIEFTELFEEIVILTDMRSGTKFETNGTEETRFGG